MKRGLGLFLGSTFIALLLLNCSTPEGMIESGSATSDSLENTGQQRADSAGQVRIINSVPAQSMSKPPEKVKKKKD